MFVRLAGGYGNQLFIYAFGLALAEKTGRELIVDNISGFGSPGDEYKSVYALDGLDIKHRLIKQSKLHYIIANKYFWYLAKKLKICYSESSSSRFEEIPPSHKLFFEGYWQSPRYFDSYKKVVKNSFRLIDQSNPMILGVKNQILASPNSVAIGMRFYEETLNASKHHIVKADTYYLKAMKLLESKITNPKYFVFSTDITRAKKVMDDLGSRDVSYVEPLKAKDNAKFDLYLMSLCQNFIISNGTFYWWAAYLGETDKSVIIAPEFGFKNIDSLPENWIKT